MMAKPLSIAYNHFFLKLYEVMYFVHLPGHPVADPDLELTEGPGFFESVHPKKNF